MPLPMRNPGPVPADTYFLGPQESSPQIESRNDGWRRGVLVSGVRRLNEANTCRARLVLGWVTSQLGQLSLASLWGRLIEYQLQLG